MTTLDKVADIQLQRRNLLIKLLQGDITLRQYKDNIISLQNIENEILNFIQ